MEALERPLRAFGIEGAGRDFSRCEIVEQCARHGRLSDPAFVGANQNYRGLLHVCPPFRLSYFTLHLPARGAKSWQDKSKDVNYDNFKCRCPVRDQLPPSHRRCCGRAKQYGSQAKVMQISLHAILLARGSEGGATIG